MENEILFFTSFSPQRRELRKIWNELDNDPSLFFCWKEFLKNADLKVLKISDSIGISLHQISITYHINELLNITI